jgi:hypothetical protein
MWANGKENYTSNLSSGRSRVKFGGGAASFGVFA